MPDRFYAAADFETDSVELTGPESHHLTHVLRKRIGDTITVFNGRGWEATGEIIETNRSATVVRLSDKRELPTPAGPQITLAVAVPKRDRFRWLAEKAMELGVHRLIPLKTERSVVEPGGGKLDKVRHTVIEAAKQCGAARLMEIADVIPWADFVSQAFQPDERIYIAHPGGEPLAEACREITPADSVCFLIGPEGGFTEDEVAQATTAGAIPVNLGPNILRIETAAIAVTAFVRLQQ